MMPTSVYVFNRATGEKVFGYPEYEEALTLDQLIEEKTGITTMVAEDPLTAVAIGTGKFIEFQHGDKKEQEFN